MICFNLLKKVHQVIQVQKDNGKDLVALALDIQNRNDDNENEEKTTVSDKDS